MFSSRGTFDCVLNQQSLRGVSGVVLNRTIEHAVSAPDADLFMYYIDCHSPLLGMFQHLLANRPWADISSRVNALAPSYSYHPGAADYLSQSSGDFAQQMLSMFFPVLERLYIQQDHIRQLIRFIDEHGHHALSLTDIAEVLSLSVDRTRHVFEEHLAMPFSQYMRWMRLRAIIQKSLYTRRPLYRIALECGFTDQSHFNRAFKQTFGIQPRHLLSTKGQNHVLLLDHQ